MASIVDATPICSTTTPPSRIPSGIEAHAPALVAPNTRPRSLAGTTSDATVSRSGLSGPAAKPTIASAASVASRGGNVARARYIRGITEKQPTKVSLLGSRWPIAL